MNTPSRDTTDRLSSLSAALQHFTDAGIDPAFDDGSDELERQFAELRMTITRD